MTQERKNRAPSLEREAILAVVILYMMITAVVLAFHYLPLEGQRGARATSSPHHQEKAGAAKAHHMQGNAP